MVLDFDFDAEATLLALGDAGDASDDWATFFGAGEEVSATLTPSTPFSFIVSKPKFIVSELALLFVFVSIVVGQSDCIVL
jgi:hypothetical protein